MYKRARDIGCTQKESAYVAGFSEASGSRIETGKHQPASRKEPQSRTRTDPLAEVWEQELEPLLRRDPRLTPTTLYEYLVERYPGQYDRQKRTLQRRVQEWKALHGNPKQVMFEIRHEPGRMGLSDFTSLKQVSITINGEPFEHLLYHYRLAYSGWQYVQAIQGGESFVALSEGLQNALHACGGVPQQHRTDSLTAAYRNVRGQRRKALTQFYEELCGHYGLTPTRNNLGVAHENGSVESSHGHFKHRLRQQLYLRGSCDFASVAAYQSFLEEVVEGLNRLHTDKFAAEKSYLRPLPRYRYADYEELAVRVTCHSSITVRCVLYTVPSRLIGHRLTVHLHHDRLVGYLGRHPVVELPRVRVPSGVKKRRARCINYRHVIDSLRRKPRAFLYCTWQQDLLPGDRWRSLWQQLQDAFEADKAARMVVEALYLAATLDKEMAVADYLEAQLQKGTLTLAGLQQQFDWVRQAAIPALEVRQHSLSDYDQLLSTGPSSADRDPPQEPDSEPNKPEPEPAPQATPSHPHAPPLGEPGEASQPRAMVLQPVLVRPVSARSGLPVAKSHQTVLGGSQTASGQELGQLQFRPLSAAQPRAPDAPRSGYRLG